VSADRARQLARRWELLELQAQVQRATLAATLAQWEQKSVLTWITGAARMAVQVLSMPRLRWLLVAELMRRFKRRH